MTKICKDCKPNCLQETPGGCLPYTSNQSMPFIGIKSAFDEDSDIQDNLIKIGKAFEEFINNNKVDLKCFGEGVDQSYVAVKALVAWACSLNTDDIGTNANMYCLNDGISVSAAKITEKSFSWSTQGLSDGVNYNYNLSGIIDNLPSTFTVNKVSVMANGQRGASSKTLLASSKESIGGFKLRPDNYPVNVTTEISIGTPDGEVMLEKNISLTGNYTSEPYVSKMNIKDLSSNNNFSVQSQTQFNEILASAYCHIKELYDSLRNIEIADCEYVKYADGHINTIIQTQSGKICEALDRLKHIGAEKISYSDCDDNCGTTITEVSIQEAFDKTGADVCDLLRRMKLLEARVTELETQVKNCCN